MAKGGSGFSVEYDPKQYAALVKAIKDIDPMIAKALRDELKETGRLLRDGIRARIMERPSSGGRSPGPHQSRKQLAAGVSYLIDTAAGKRQALTIEVSPSKLSPGREPFAKAWNLPRWRHPVFGNKRVWVFQQGNPYFNDTKEPTRLGNLALERALDTVTTQLEH